MLYPTGRWPFNVLVLRGHTAPHGMPMPNVPSGPLLFVIGTPNVAALHWCGRLQKCGWAAVVVFYLPILTLSETPSPLQATGCGLGLCPPVETRARSTQRWGYKKFRLSERLREARYFPRSEYCRGLAVVPVAAGGAYALAQHCA